MVTCKTCTAEVVADMNDDPTTEDQPPLDTGNLRFLRILVTVLTATMIAGLIAIFTVIVIRFPGGSDALALPDAIELPDGVEPEAVTIMTDRIVVIAGQEILVFDRNGGVQHRIDLTEN